MRNLLILFCTFLLTSGCGMDMQFGSDPVEQSEALDINTDESVPSTGLISSGPEKNADEPSSASTPPTDTTGLWAPVEAFRYYDGGWYGTFPNYNIDLTIHKIPSNATISSQFSGDSFIVTVKQPQCLDQVIIDRQNFNTLMLPLLEVSQSAIKNTTGERLLVADNGQHFMSFDFGAHTVLRQFYLYHGGYPLLVESDAEKVEEVIEDFLSSHGLCQ